MRRLVSGVGLSVMVAIVAIADGGCRKPPKAGGHCEGADFVAGVGVCAEDGQTYLACEMDGYHPYACKGARGCFGKGKGKLHEVCDFSRATDGDLCPPNDARPTPAQCTPDGTAMVVCDRMTFASSPHTVFRRRACGGPKGCATGGPGVLCDERQAKPGDPCDIASDASYVHPLYTCGPGGASMLACRRVGDLFQWQPARSCRGAKGCVAVPETRNVSCDATVADEGDPCQEGNLACARDGTARLACKAGTFVRERACKPACTTTWTSPGTWDVVCPE